MTLRVKERNSVRNHIKIVTNPNMSMKGDISFLSEEKAKEVMHYHESFPQYQRTPLQELSGLADSVNISGLYVKDEDYRFGLHAFKVLGGSYAMGQYIRELMEVTPEELSYDYIKSEDVYGKISELTFISTTDGNHGRGVAWTANQLGCKCIIHMPKGTVKERLEHIQKEGACADITEYNYDTTVRMTAKEAEDNGYILVQDTSWEGYEQIPTWITQGYLTMAYEVYMQLQEQKVIPTHILIQAGVGSLAAAITGFFKNVYKEYWVRVIVIESEKADCFYRTVAANDGTLHKVDGDMDTIMAGLACGEICSVAWEVLSDYADYYVSCSDGVTVDGMRALAYPIQEDAHIVSGESGAVPVGLTMNLLQDPRHQGLKELVGLNEESVVVCFNTEGATNKEGYEKIVKPK